MTDILSIKKAVEICGNGNQRGKSGIRYGRK